MNKNARTRFIQNLSASEIQALSKDWLLWARPDQLPPKKEWAIWLMMGGRGAGKTRAGAEWVRGIIHGEQPFASHRYSRVALIGESFHDVQHVMIEGPSGLLQIHGSDEKPEWQKTNRQIVWPNGAIAQVFSAQDPESLRGPQFMAAWIDELAKWRYDEETWNMLQFCMRLGHKPLQMITTTPKPTPLIKKIMAMPNAVVTRSPTRLNSQNLSASFLEAINERYGSTALGRQEIEGELIENVQGALWQRDQFDKYRLTEAPELERIVVAIDPPITSHYKSDACGIVIAGRTSAGKGIILKDATAQQLQPHQWAKRAVDLYAAVEADCLVVEINQGGEMVIEIIRQVEPQIPIRAVNATRGKWLRAEPVAALYACGKIHHLQQMPELEDEMCNFTLQGLPGGKSPDRLDALVWALTDLFLHHQNQPGVRQI